MPKEPFDFVAAALKTSLDYADSFEGLMASESYELALRFAMRAIPIIIEKEKPCAKHIVANFFELKNFLCELLKHFDSRSANPPDENSPVSITLPKKDFKTYFQFADVILEAIDTVSAKWQYSSELLALLVSHLDNETILENAFLGPEDQFYRLFTMLLSKIKYCIRQNDVFNFLHIIKCATDYFRIPNRATKQNHELQKRGRTLLYFAANLFEKNKYLSPATKINSYQFCHALALSTENLSVKDRRQGVETMMKKLNFEAATKWLADIFSARERAHKFNPRPLVSQLEIIIAGLEGAGHTSATALTKMLSYYLLPYYFQSTKKQEPLAIKFIIGALLSNDFQKHQQPLADFMINDMLFDLLPLREKYETLLTALLDQPVGSQAALYFAMMLSSHRILQVINNTLQTKYEKQTSSYVKLTKMTQDSQDEPVAHIMADQREKKTAEELDISLVFHIATLVWQSINKKLARHKPSPIIDAVIEKEIIDTFTNKLDPYATLTRNLNRNMTALFPNCLFIIGKNIDYIALKLLHADLTLDEEKSDPLTWVKYVMFCIDKHNNHRPHEKPLQYDIHISKRNKVTGMFIYGDTLLSLTLVKKKQWQKHLQTKKQQKIKELAPKKQSTPSEKKLIVAAPKPKKKVEPKRKPVETPTQPITVVEYEQAGKWQIQTSRRKKRDNSPPSSESSIPPSPERKAINVTEKKPAPEKQKKRRRRKKKKTQQPQTIEKTTPLKEEAEQPKISEEKVQAKEEAQPLQAEEATPIEQQRPPIAELLQQPVVHPFWQWRSPLPPNTLPFSDDDTVLQSLNNLLDERGAQKITERDLYRR